MLIINTLGVLIDLEDAFKATAATGFISTKEWVAMPWEPIKFFAEKVMNKLAKFQFQH